MTAFFVASAWCLGTGFTGEWVENAVAGEITGVKGED